MQLQPQIDPERIGVWGFSFSGAHVLQVAAFDRRIRCVVAQVPAVSGFLVAQRSNSPLDLDGMRMMLSKDRIQRYETREVNYLPFVAPRDGRAFSLLLVKHANSLRPHKAEVKDVSKTELPSSLWRLSYFEPAVRIDAIAPTPLRMVLAKKDFLIPTNGVATKVHPSAPFAALSR